MVYKEADGQTRIYTYNYQEREQRDIDGVMRTEESITKKGQIVMNLGMSKTYISLKPQNRGFCEAVNIQHFKNGLCIFKIRSTILREEN